jgi:uncharacterized protein (TIGR02001 family)
LALTLNKIFTIKTRKNMKNKTKILLLAVCLTSTFSSMSLAESESQSALSGNISIASNYACRGKAQHLDKAGNNDTKSTLSGGLDYDFDNGFKVGTWGSNVSLGDASSEVYFYTDYSTEVNNIDYKIGYIAYTYSGAKDTNFEEIYIGTSYANFGLTYYQGQDEAANYVEASYGVNIEDIDISASIGQNSDTTGNNDGYKVYGIGLSKAYKGLDYSLNFTKTSEDDSATANQNHTIFSISKSF